MASKSLANAPSSREVIAEVKLKHPQPPTKLEAEVGVGAIGAGEPLATAPIQVCWGSDRADLLGAKAPEGPAYRYDRCRGKPAGSLCPEPYF